MIALATHVLARHSLIHHRYSFIKYVLWQCAYSHQSTKPTASKHEFKDRSKRQSTQSVHATAIPSTPSHPLHPNAFYNNNYHNAYNVNRLYNRNGANNGARSPKPMLSMSSTSITDVSENANAEAPPQSQPHPKRKSKNVHAVYDTLWTIKQNQKRMDNQQQHYTANVEQLFLQQQKYIASLHQDDDQKEEINPQEAYLGARVSGHHKGGSSMNLTKRISQHDRGSSEKQIASALPASFTKYQGIKKSYSHEHKDEKAAAEAQFVPPPPPPSMGPYGKSNQ
eukprot:32956_1